MARSQSIGTKLTPDEERQILVAAEADGKAPSEWARDLLLRGAVASNRGETEMHLFTELVGIQMLLMNALDPLLRGEKMTRENPPLSTAESRQRRPRKRKNSSQSAPGAVPKRHGEKPNDIPRIAENSRGRGGVKAALRAPLRVREP